MGYAARTDGELLGTTLNTTGFPGDLSSSEGMYFARGSCTGVDARVITYNGTMDTAGGQCGSGVWTYVGNNRYVVAIHTFWTAVCNGGTRITGAGMAKVVVDTWKQTVAWSFTGLGFTSSLENPVALTLTSGNDRSTNTSFWFESSPWHFRY